MLLLLACVVAVFSSGTEAASISQCQMDPLATSINSMGSQLVKQLKEPGNYFVSPLSVHSALAMTYLGANGDTANEMESAFKLKESGFLDGTARFHDSYSKLLDGYRKTNDQYSLKVANGVFVQQDYPVRDNYVTGLKDYYSAVIKSLDFQGKSELAKDEINGWVAGNTENKIEELLSEPLDPSTKLAILNAVYFKGTWKVQFDKEETRDGQFYTTENSSKRVKFMHLHKEKMPYFEDKQTGYKFLEMPYKGENVAMLFALPEHGDYSPNLQLGSSELCRINQGLQKVKLDQIMIPKFHLEYTAKLKEPLRGTGIRKLFESTEADLGSISEAMDLYVSEVLHKAVVDVSEEGSEAAAVTGVIIENRMGSSDPSFVANSPFLFYIVDKKSGVVLFAGRVAEP